MNIREILVHPAAEALSSEARTALMRLAPVRFKSCPRVEECPPGAVLVSLSGDDAVPGRLTGTGARCFHVTRGVDRASVRSTPGVQFEDSRQLDPMFRGRRIAHKPLAKVSSVAVEPGDEVIARWEGEPIWIVRERSGVSLNIVSVPVPEPGPRQMPFDYLDGEAFIQLLPLLHFLRQTSGTFEGERQRPRACLMFDDPNLHWPSYGFIHFQKVVEQARAYGYHVAFATVPADAWGLNREAVELFRANSRHVSLLVHGNNHSRNELAQPRTLEGHSQLLAQSLSRIARLERATGLKVDRIMAPPHEACAETTTAAMLALGFEGTCLSPWMLRHWNSERKWPATFGLEMADLVEDGFPAIPRFRLDAGCEGPIVISAYLGKPIIPVGHNCSVADGLDLLARLSDVINSLGNVQWGSAEMIARSNYAAVREMETLRVTPYSCKIAVPVPEGVTRLVVETLVTADWICADAGSFSGGASAPLQRTTIKAGLPVPVKAGDTVELISSKLGTKDYRQFKSPAFSIGAWGRRLMCETRDRLVVLKPRSRTLKARTAA